MFSNQLSSAILDNILLTDESMFVARFTAIGWVDAAFQ